jgi:DNA helicase-2/ATP-dependent DNA helicase PcrA
VLETIQRRYRSVLVDEYQDVNRAQAEILDLITEPQRNYMVIGDDDQTIYEWRGADPSHLHTFKRRYRRAATYFMTENFRSRASQIVLANQIMEHEPQRQRKLMQVVRGFGGETGWTSMITKSRWREPLPGRSRSPP